MTAIAIQHREQIIQRMAKGEPITAIALSLGYADHSGIVHRLDSDPEYKAALRSGIIGKIEKREGELERAQDNVTVTRSDRLLGHARWWAERLDPDRFGQRTHMTIETGPGDLDERIRRAMAAERAVIDSQAREVPDVQQIEEKP